MPLFKHPDWFSLNIGLIERHTEHLCNQPIRILEVGCFEGRSTLWLLDRFEQAKIVCVDSFAGGEEHEGIDFDDVKTAFLQNTAGRNRNLFCCLSVDYFRTYANAKFDFAFVDGSHRANDVLRDLIGCYDLLVDGGIIVADDYMWAGYPNEPHRSPKLGIDSFIACFKDKVEVLEIEYSAALRKIK